MNREIKFRAWDKSCNKMRGISGLQDCFSLRSDGVCNEDYVLMQYTGLKDINGKEIYECDVLEFPFEKGIAYVINDGFRFAVKSYGSQTIEYESEDVLKKTKIIGNIFETIYHTQSSE